VSPSIKAAALYLLVLTMFLGLMFPLHVGALLFTMQHKATNP